MVDKATHCYYNKMTMGDSGYLAHKYLDRHFYKYGAFHRKILHHWEGIAECATYLSQNSEKSDYDYWYEAAILHVKLDFHIGGKQYEIPNRKDYVGGDGSWPQSAEWGPLKSIAESEDKGN